MNQTQLRIIGMTCGGCVSRVEKALRGVPSVKDASVNLMTESASITADGGNGVNQALLDAVRSAGYDAEVIPAKAEWTDRLSDDRELKETLRRHRQGLIQAIGLALPILAIDYSLHGGHVWGHGASGPITARVLQIVLMVMLAVSPGGGPILAGGLRALLHRTANMDLLITLGVVVASLSSVYGTFIAQDHAFIHFHAAAMILSLVVVGRYLEARAKGRTSAAMAALAKRAPKEALVYRDDEWRKIPADQIAEGDVVKIPPHTAIPADGDVREGEADVDESLMTGEPLPVHRRPGDKVLGGTLVVDGQLVIRTTAVGARAAVGRIMQLVRQAQAGRTEMQRLADKVAGIFTPIVVSVAAITFAAWLLLGGENAGSNAARAAIAVLVVACPCALGLATPTVVLVASGIAALRGILVRSPAQLETLGQIDMVIWDKTGTLTQGRPQVIAVEPAAGFSESEVLQLAAEAEQLAVHPLAKAIVDQARRSFTPPDKGESGVLPSTPPAKGGAGGVFGTLASVNIHDSVDPHLPAVSPPNTAPDRLPNTPPNPPLAGGALHAMSLRQPSTFESKPGGGVIARIAGHRVVVGKPDFVASQIGRKGPEIATVGAGPHAHSEHNALASASTRNEGSSKLLVHRPSTMPDDATTSVAVAIDGKYAGLISLTDAIRPSAHDAIRRLRRLGIESVMLTGDAAPAAQAVARQLDIAQVFADASPEQKVETVLRLKQSSLPPSEIRAASASERRARPAARPEHLRAPDDVVHSLTSLAGARGSDQTQPAPVKRARVGASRRVAMVGDGINDAAALAAADVGIAFATGADIAAESAGVNLIGSTPHLVADAVVLARASLRVIRQNLFWAFFYNILMIPLAAANILPPAVAAGAMMVSSLTVVLNALRLPRVAGLTAASTAL